MNNLINISITILLIISTSFLGYYKGKSEQLEKYIQVQVQDFPETLHENDKQIIKENK